VPLTPVPYPCPLPPSLHPVPSPCPMTPGLHPCPCTPVEGDDEGHKASQVAADHGHAHLAHMLQGEEFKRRPPPSSSSFTPSTTPVQAQAQVRPCVSRARAREGGGWDAAAVGCSAGDGRRHATVHPPRILHLCRGSVLYLTARAHTSAAAPLGDPVSLGKSACLHRSCRVGDCGCATLPRVPRTRWCAHATRVRCQFCHPALPAHVRVAGPEMRVDARGRGCVVRVHAFGGIVQQGMGTPAALSRRTCVDAHDAAAPTRVNPHVGSVPLVEHEQDVY
jgi:hypothetical protein